MRRSWALWRRAPLRILTVFVRHGAVRYPTALEDLRDVFRRRLPSVRHDLVVVENDAAAPAQEAGLEVVRGSNRRWEFSAWDEGLLAVGSLAREYELVHLATSAFLTLYTRYLERFDERMLRLVAARRAAVGHIDCYGEPVELLGRRSQAWIRSSFLFVPPAELERLGSLVGVADPAPFFSGDPRRPFREDAPLSSTYRKLLLDWLTGPGTGQGVTWHSRFELTAETLPYFEQKVLAILNEHLLSIRLREQGCATVDATWLATRAARRWGRSPLAEIPHWAEQLAGRDTDPVRPARITP
jgi:hypothetical protein